MIVNLLHTRRNNYIYVIFIFLLMSYGNTKQGLEFHHSILSNPKKKSALDTALGAPCHLSYKKRIEAVLKITGFVIYEFLYKLFFILNNNYNNFPQLLHLQYLCTHKDRDL